MRKFRLYFGLSDNNTYQDLWDSGKTVFIGKHIASNAHIGKTTAK